MADYWVKLYVDILNDPKYQTLSERAQLGMLELLVVAKTAEIQESLPKGQLPSIVNIAFYTRRSVEWWKPVIEELKTHHVRPFLIEEGGVLIIRKYQIRQAKIDDLERQRRKRAKPEPEPESDQLLSRVVTNDVTDRDIEKRRERERVRVREEEEKEEDVVAASGNDNNNIFQQLNQEFESASGISRSNCNTKEKKRWDESLQQIARAGISTGVINKTVQSLLNKGYVVSGPWSIVKAAQIELATARQKIPKDENNTSKYLSGPYADLIIH